MNWVGGARQRLKFQGDRRLQKEFFEKKKLDLKCEKLQKASYCHSVSKKKKLSQDLVALRTVSNTSVKAGNSPRSVKVQHVDLGRHHAAGVSRRSGDHRSALGSCLSRVPESVELPFSPDHLPSKLLLQEPVMPSTSGDGKNVRVPSKRKNKEHTSSSQDMGSSFQVMADLNPVTPRTPKENEDPFHTPKRMRAQHSPHRHPPPQTSLSDRYTTSTATKTSNKNAYGFQAPSSTVHTDARFTNPWMPEEDFKLFNMKKIHEKFQSPLFASQEVGTRDSHQTSKAADKKSWIPYKYPFGLRHSEDICSTKSDLTLKEHKQSKHASHETSIHHHRTANYGGSQSNMKTTWTSKDSRTDLDAGYHMAVSPVKIPAQPTPQLSTSSSTGGSMAESLCVGNTHQYKDLQPGMKQVTNDGFRAHSAFDDHLTIFSQKKNIPQTTTETTRTERQLSHLKHSIRKPSIFSEFENEDYQQKLKGLWLPEDFQPSPKPNRKVSSETPQISLSAYTPAFRKPPISKWETFLTSPDEPSSLLDVPRTPSPNFWKITPQKMIHSSSLSESRAASSQITCSSAIDMRNHSDSGTSSTHKLKSKNKLPTDLLEVGQSSLKAVRGVPPSFRCQTREDDHMQARGKTESRELAAFDWRRNLYAYRQMSSPDTRDKRSGREHTRVSTSCRIGLTTPISNMLQEETRKPPTPKRWPMTASQGEEILRELEELDTLPSSDHATTATRRQVTPLSVDGISRHESPPKVLQASQDLLHRRADHDDRHSTHQDTDHNNHCRSKSALIQPADSQHNLKLSQPCSTPPDSTADEDDVKLHISFNSQSSEVEGSLDLDTSVLGPGDCSDAESDPDSGLQDAVEFLVHQVVMEENRNSLADVLTADKGQVRTLWSGSETLDKRSTFLRDSPMSVTNSNHAGNGGQSQRDKHYSSVHVQTDWTLLHADIPSNWLPGAPVAVTIWVDRETQWELPPTQLGAADIQPCMESTNPPSEQHRAASPADEETQTEPAPTPTDKKIVEVETATPALILSPKQNMNSRLLSSHPSTADCQEISVVGSLQDLPDTPVLSVSREKVNIPEIPPVNDPTDDLKIDILAEIVTAENMKSSGIVCQNFATESTDTSEICTKNLPKQKVDKPRKPLMNLPKKEAEIPKMSPKAQSQTESNSSQPQNPQSNQINTQLACQQTIPIANKMVESPNADGSTICTEKDKETDLHEQTEAPTIVATEHNHTVAKQAVDDSSSSPSAQYIPETVTYTNKDHCSHLKEGDAPVRQSVPHESYVQSPTQSLESISTDSASLSLNLNQARLTRSSSNTDHGPQVGNNATTSTEVKKIHSTPVDVDSCGDSTEHMKSKRLDTITAIASMDTKLPGGKNFKPTDNDAEVSGSEMLPLPDKQSSSQNMNTVHQ